MRALETERLLLREFRAADAGDCFAFLSDRETCYLDGGYEPTPDTEEERQKLTAAFTGQEGRIVVEYKPEGRVAGIIHLMEDHRRRVPAVELGYIISPAYRRRGLAEEALREVIRCCFEERGLAMVTAGAVSCNAPSLALLRKLGFVREGFLHKAFRYPPLGIVDLECFYLDKEDWQKFNQTME